MGPTYLDALSLASEVADDLVLRTVRDTHDFWADRFGGYPGRPITTAVYAGAGLGLRAAAYGLDKVGHVGPQLEDGPRGRFVSSAVNGLVGDRLAAERPRMAITMAVRSQGRDVDLGAVGAVDQAFPDATGQVVVFLHGLCETEAYWDRGPAPTYGEALAGRGWTPVFLRANTGLGLRPNGVALSALVQRLVEAWPVPVTRIALVGHSMGGLILRAAGAVASDVEAPWTDLVSDVVTLGTPHLGAPIARGIETVPLGRLRQWRSVGVHDLVVGLAEDVPPLPHARYRLVAATITTKPRHPVGHVIGDWLVRVESAYGADLFPGATRLHLGRTDHFGLLNHPRVHEALREWLA